MGFFSGLCSAVSSVCSCIGGAISGLASGLSSVLGLGSGIAGLVCGVIKGVASILGLGEEKEKPEELGLRAEKSDKKLEDFDTYKEYKEYLDKIELTQKDFDKLEDPEKKQGYSIVGTAVYLQGINEHYDMLLSPSTFVTLAGLGIKNPEDTKTFLDKCKENRVKPDFDKLENGKLSIKEENKLIDTLKESVIDMNDSEEISNKLDEMLKKL